MSLPGPLPPGCMPDFSRVHSVQSKKAAQFKSESARSLTEFREFKFTGGARRAGKFSAATAAKIAAQAEQAQQQQAQQAQKPAAAAVANKSTKNKENAGPHSAAAPAAKKAKTVVEPSTPRLTLDSAALHAPKPPLLLPASVVAFTPSKLQQPRILPPPPQQFAFAAPAPAPVARVLALAPASAAAVPVSASSFAPIPESPADSDADAEFGAVFSSSSSSAAAAAAATAAVDDPDFYSMDSCLQDILNDEAWKDDDDEQAQAEAEGEGADTVTMTFAAPAAASSLPPCTPGRLGSGAARVLTGTTPRAGGAADRGSIYGGAIRTPLRTKPPTPAIKTVPARLTIAGVLPSAAASRTATTTTAMAAGPLGSPAPVAGFGLSAAQRVKPVSSAAQAAPMATPVKPGAVIFRIAPSPAAHVPMFAAHVPTSSLAMLPPKTPARK